MSEKCNLQVRLFDGTSIRSKFDANATLTTAVRAFVSEHSDNETPYNFRLMDLPRPSKTIEISEESQSLKELGLCPGATLVLVPVKDFTDAYASSGLTGLASKGLGLGYNVVAGIVGGIGSMIGTATRTDGTYVAGTGDDTSTRPADGRQVELYNGNQLGIVPKTDNS